MKTLNLFKNNARWLMAVIAILTIGVGNAWAGLRGDLSLVTEVSTLTGGGTFIIAHNSGSPASNYTVVPMRNETNATTSVTGSVYSGATSGSSTSGTIDLEDDELDLSPYEFTIVTGKQSGTISIKLTSGTYKDYYISFSGSSNHDLKMSSTITNNTSFTPTYSSSRWHLENYGQDDRYLRYWTSNSAFKFTNAADNSGGSQWLVIYKKADCTPPSTALSITSSSSVTMGSTLSLTTNSGSGGGNGGSITWSVISGTGSATVVGSTLTPSTPGTVTVKATQAIYDGKCAGYPTQTVTINKRTATIVLNEAGSESTVSGTHYELDEYTLPSSSGETCGDKVLVGWSKVEVEETDTKPTSNYYAKGTTITLAPGENYFYAVYATATAGAGDWEKYTESTIAEGDYLIVHASYNYAMTNVVTENTLGSQFVSISNDVITYNSDWAAACTWHIAKSGDYYTIKNGSNYVIGTGTASQANLSASPSSNNEKFSMTFNSDPKTYKFVNAYNSAQSVSAVLKRGGSGGGAKYACYTDVSPYPNLFKRGYGYSEYSTDCCEKPATELSITNVSPTVAMGNTLTMTSTGGNGDTKTWSVTSGTGSATINSSGVLTPTSAGSVTVKVHQDERTVSETKYCKQDDEIEVIITISVTGVEVDPTSKAIIPGETFTITPTVSPVDATDQSVSWTSNATAKATVDENGVVTGVAAGSATITCTTTDQGQTATCTVTVYAVTLAVVNESGTDISSTVDLPTRTGINISPAANAGGYVFKEWEITNASLGSSETTKNNTITTPTGAVTVKAVYREAKSVTWLVDGVEWTAGSPSTAVEYGTQYKDLTYPTDPTTEDACGDRFMGWTTADMGATLGQSQPDPLLRAGNSNTTAITGNITFYAVFADYNE